EQPPAGFQRTHEEQELADEHGLDDAQLYWRRRKIATNGLDLFQQEYPCTANEAFITSGRPVFDTPTLQEWKDAAPLPLYRMAVEPVTDDKGESTLNVIKHPRGELNVYIERKEGDTYYI